MISGYFRYLSLTTERTENTEKVKKNLRALCGLSGEQFNATR